MKTIRLCFVSFIIFLTFSIEETAFAKQEQGELLHWEKVNHLLPKYTIFTVRDIETGKEFHVQRRAGSRHADVQPLTEKDTKTMKEIYQGKWSWKRRAILVIYKKKKIAASMNGMPHGAGSLQNNFPGHFCIHFYGSRTHRSNSMDLSHKLMVLKAAGKLNEYLSSLEPVDVVKAYIAGFKENEKQIIQNLSLQKVPLEKVLSSLENVTNIKIPPFSTRDLQTQWTLSIPVQVDWEIKGGGVKSFQGNIHLVRFSPYDSWKIDSHRFFEDNHFPIEKASNKGS